MLKTRMLLVGFATAALATMTMAQDDGPAPLAWRWVQSTAISPGGTPLVDGETVYVGVGQRVWALDKDTGNQKWKFPTVEPLPAYFRTSPIKVGNLIIAAADNKTIYALDKDTGEKKWQYISVEPILGQPVAVGDRQIAVALGDNSIVAVNTEDGTPSWNAPLKLTDPIVGKISSNANSIFVLTQANDLLAIDGTLHKISWKKNFTSIGADAQPVVFGDMIYVNSTTFVVAMTTSGSFRWSSDAGDFVTYPVAASPDGIAAATRDGKVVFFDGKSGRRITHQELLPGSTKTVTVDSVDLGSFALTAPSAVGHVFVFTTTAGTVTMFDPRTGRLLWNYTIKPLVKGEAAAPTTPPGGIGGGRLGGGAFGGGASTAPTAPATSVAAAGPPVMAGGTLLVLAKDGSLLAFDKTSGVDLTPPTVAMTFPRPGDQVTSLDLELHFQLDDESSGLKVDSVVAMVDNKKLDYKLGRDGELTIRFTLSGKNGTLSDGRHAFTITSSDWLGNTSTATYSLTIDNNLPKLGPPPKTNGVGGPGGPGGPTGAGGLGGGG